MSGPDSTELLASRRVVRYRGREVVHTPLIVPSFSSKGFPDVEKIVKTMEEAITDCLLVSAYDIYYDYVPSSITFAEVVFVDSGGYECSKDAELSDLGYLEHHPRPWSQSLYEDALKKWSFDVPTVLISYDHPKQRATVATQVKRAVAFFRGRKVIKELLIKPETEASRYLKIENVLRNASKFAPFDILGFTEKELGNNLLDRMVNIARVRFALKKRRLNVPIHIFGSLDPITTPLYFLAGADIFDGLTWLRLAYKDGVSIYTHNFAALTIGTQIRDDQVQPRVWFSNYYALQELQRSMRNYLNAKDFHRFGHHLELFETTFQALIAELRRK